MTARQVWTRGAAALAVLFAFAAGARAEPRKLLHPAEVGGPLAELARKLIAPDEGAVADEALKASGYYARVVARKYVLDDQGKLIAGARLGTRPFVFLTAPEGLVGKPLYRVFGDIGYSANDFLADKIGVETVVIVFRYRDAPLHAAGALSENWDLRVYPSTWENAFGLFTKLAEKGEVNAENADGRPTPERLAFRSAAEYGFAINFPVAGIDRIRKTPYAVLQHGRGADWEYRALLESKMSMSEHFAGSGLTRPMILPGGKPRRGMPEFLGPNAELSKLPEFAVIGLGALRVAE